MAADILKVKQEKTTESICRLCLMEPEHSRSIFREEFPTLAAWIENLTSLKIINIPDAPASLCMECENTLNSFESFREMCFTNDRLIKEMFTQDDSVNDRSAVPKEIPFKTIFEMDQSEGHQPSFADFTNDSQLDKNDITTMPTIPTDLVPCSSDLCQPNYSQASQLGGNIQVHLKPDIIGSTGNAKENEPSPLENVGKSESLLEPVTTSGIKDKRKYCSICNKFVKQLFQHQLIHNKIRPYQCEYCSKGFTQKYKLTQHIRKHTNEKPYICIYCDKRFPGADKLKIHIRSHTQERPFKCKDCGKSFITSSHLLQHKQTHSSLKPYPCDLCQSKFRRNSHLTRHKERVHLIKQSNVTTFTAEENQPNCGTVDQNIRKSE